MRYYEARSTIAASPEAVWAVLSDGARWAAWDSGVDAVEGQIAMGETIKIRTQSAPGRTFPVRVTVPDLGPSFDAFARGLKVRVESGG